MAQPIHSSGYFKFVLTWLKVLGVPIEPLDAGITGKLLYTIYSVTFLILFPMGFLVSQICEVPNSLKLKDLKRLMFGLGYIFSDSLGNVAFLLFWLYA